jgi:hypothetical protein
MYHLLVAKDGFLGILLQGFYVTCFALLKGQQHKIFDLWFFPTNRPHIVPEFTL